MNGGFTGFNFEEENTNNVSTNTMDLNNLYNTSDVPINNLNNTGNIPVNDMYNTGNIPLNNMYNTGNIPTTNLYNTGNIPANDMYNTGNIPATNLYNTGSIPVDNMNNTGSIPTAEEKNEELVNTNTLDLGNTVKIAPPTEAPLINPKLPNTRGLDSTKADPNIRFNPVTGEEMNIKDIVGDKEEEKVDNEEKLKTVKINYKQPSTANTVLLIFFFIFLILFVMFLPEIQTVFDNFKNRGNEVEIVEITTGKLVCTLESNTTNFDKNYDRVFNYEDNKLKTSKLTTITKGDATLDEKALNELFEQCNQIKTNTEELDGIGVSCKLEANTLEEVETFDYSKYDIDKVSQVYLDAGSSILDFEADADINRVMTAMRQSGFTCEKEK